MRGARCTEEFLVYPFIGAMHQLLSTPLNFSAGFNLPTVSFQMSQTGVGDFSGRVRLEAVSDEFVVFTLEAEVDAEAFTQALRRALRTNADDRRVVEMSSAAGTLTFRFYRPIFAPNAD